MIIDIISDLHGFFPKLEGGDLLIIAGDLTANDSPSGHKAFLDWLSAQNYKKKIFISGNHDNHTKSDFIDKTTTTYLCDSGVEFEGLKIWGSPWTKKFYGQNPHTMAFALSTDSQMREKWISIPKELDILITHSPPQGIHDQTTDYCNVGCRELLTTVDSIRPKLHIFGHIHEGYGQTERNGTIFVNASHVNQNYEPVNMPIRIAYTQTFNYTARD